MKLVIEIDVPETIPANEIRDLIREFQFMARLRKLRLFASLPGVLRCKRANKT